MTESENENDQMTMTTLTTLTYGLIVNASHTYHSVKSSKSHTQKK